MWSINRQYCACRYQVEHDMCDRTYKCRRKIDVTICLIGVGRAGGGGGQARAPNN